MRRSLLVALFVVSSVASFAAGRTSQDARPSNVGATFVSGSGMSIKVLLDASTLGASDLDIAEITFPAGSDSGDHPHGSTETFYVLSGELEHVVNGVSTTLRPGMVGFVRPPDRVRHRTAVETKALVIWTPGGEAARIVRNWTRRNP
ncbi:MAG: cupin domain-containing protein [Vicinamibacterales bacterium]